MELYNNKSCSKDQTMKNIQIQIINIKNKTPYHKKKYVLQHRLSVDDIFFQKKIVYVMNHFVIYKLNTKWLIMFIIVMVIMKF